MAEMKKRQRVVSLLWMAAVAVLLLIQTGPLQGQARRHDPPKEMPSFSLPGLDGDKHSLEDYKDRFLVLSLWATWCLPCRYELPEFQRAREVLAASHPEAVLMTVNMGESGARAKLWLKKHDLELPVLLATDKFALDYGVISLPAILIFDRQGRLAVSHDGWVMGTDLVEEIGADLETLSSKASN